MQNATPGGDSVSGLHCHCLWAKNSSLTKALRAKQVALFGFNTVSYSYSLL